MNNSGELTRSPFCFITLGLFITIFLSAGIRRKFHTSLLLWGCHHAYPFLSINLVFLDLLLLRVRNIIHHNYHIRQHFFLWCNVCGGWTGHGRAYFTFDWRRKLNSWIHFLYVYIMFFVMVLNCWLLLGRGGATWFVKKGCLLQSILLLIIHTNKT
jgi:hypothetical protein